MIGEILPYLLLIIDVLDQFSHVNKAISTRSLTVSYLSIIVLFSSIRYVLVFVKCLKNLFVSLDDNTGFETFGKKPYLLNDLRVSTFFIFFDIKKMCFLVCVMRNYQVVSCKFANVNSCHLSSRNSLKNEGDPLYRTNKMKNTVIGKNAY